MKRILFTLCLAIVVLTVSSCQKDNNVAPAARTIFTSTTNFTSTDGGLTYSADVSVPEIDNYYNNNGAVLVYQDTGNSNYAQLPFVYNGYTFSFTYTGGHVYIDAQDSNGTSTISKPNNINLKIVLVN